MLELTEAEMEPFTSLLAEIECGTHFSDGNPEHVSWLKHRIDSHTARGTRFFGCRTELGEILGIVGILMQRKLYCPATAEVVSLGVVSAHRRCGLGTELLNHALDVARAEGACAVFARTYAADTNAVAFYGRNAFYPVAVIPGTNGPADEGDIVMRRTLCDEPDAVDG